MALSQRAVASLAAPNPLREVFDEVKDIFQPNNAIINIGLAQNELMEDKLVAKIKECLTFEPSDASYGDPHGSRKLRGIVASMLNRHFKPRQELTLDHIIVTTGSGAALYFLTQAIMDPGDSALVLAPYYGNFDADLCVLTGVDLVPVYLDEHDDGAVTVRLHVLEAALQDAANRGKRIKSFLITNPHNPLGKCFSRESLETLVQFASKHKLHLISDEVYGLSAFGHLLDKNEETEPFVSVLSLSNLPDLIDTSYVHVVHGMSKDFNLNGIRVGFIIEQYNPRVIDMLKLSALFSYTTSITDRLLCNLLSDEEFIDSFIEENQKRLAEGYRYATNLLDEHGLSYIPADGGHFLLVDARSKNSHIRTFADEKKVWKCLLESGVYIGLGQVFHTRVPGFYRLTFSLKPDKLAQGIRKLVTALERNVAQADQK